MVICMVVVIIRPPTDSQSLVLRITIINIPTVVVGKGIVDRDQLYWY